MNQVCPHHVFPAHFFNQTLCALQGPGQGYLTMVIFSVTKWEATSAHLDGRAGSCTSLGAPEGEPHH